MPNNHPQSPARQILGFLGVGLDNTDGEERVTRSEHFVLIGGSHETHTQMQDTAVRFDQALKQRGKQLKETSLEEVIEIFHQSRE